MKKLTMMILAAGLTLSFMANVALALEPDHEDTVARVGVMNPAGTYTVLYAVDASGNEFSFNSTYTTADMLLFKSMEAQLLLAKATGKRIIFRTNGVKDAKGMYNLYGVIIEE